MEATQYTISNYVTTSNNQQTYSLTSIPDYSELKLNENLFVIAFPAMYVNGSYTGAGVSIRASAYNASTGIITINSGTATFNYLYSKSLTVVVVR